MKKPRKSSKSVPAAIIMSPTMAPTQGAIPPPGPITLKEVSITPFMTPESICDKARRLAQEDEVARKAAQRAKKQAFLDSMFKPGEYTLNDDGTYTICGWKWQLWAGDEANGPYLTFNASAYWQSSPPHLNLYRGVVLSYQSANDPLSLGRALRGIDENVADIDYCYPNTLMGRLSLWFATH